MTTIILAKILGLYFLAVGFALMINPDRFKKIVDNMKIDKSDDQFLLLGGLIALLFGVMVISTHNIWVRHWQVLITIVGWWSFIKGFILIAFPGSILYFTYLDSGSHLFYRVIGVLYLVLGVFFIYKGWV